ncbi:MAG: tetratricopeptide repeat protein [Phycisphaerae bacterium]|nr:tetratricopeptide repeat protein [Saprospiraceae bacterium]
MAHTAEEWFRIGNEKHEKGQYEEAIKAFGQSFEVDPTYVNIYIGRGLAKSGLGDYEGAIDDFDQAIDLDPKYVAAYVGRGIANLELANNEESIADYDQAIKVDPNYGKAYGCRALVKYRLGHYITAIADYDYAIHLDPKDAISYSNRGQAKYSLGYKTFAIEDYDRAIEIDPKFSDAYNNRGLAKYKSGETEASIRDYDSAIEFCSTNALAFNNRGLAKASLGSYHTAIVDYGHALNIAPNLAMAYANRSAARYNLTDYHSAISDCEKAIQIDPNYEEAYLIRGISYRLLMDYYQSQLDVNRFIYLANRISFFQNPVPIFNFYHENPAPYLLHRTLEKFTDDFDQFNTLDPIVDTTYQQCRLWKRWEEWRNLSGSEKHEPLAHYHALALVNHYMGDCIEAYRIYDEVLGDEKAKGVPLNLLGLYYYIESAKLFRQEYAVILEDAIEQIEETREELIENNALRELYYAGQILWANDQIIEAHEYFELADDYLPAAYMQLLTLPMMSADEDNMEAKIAEIREREADLTPGEGFLQGFPTRPFRLEKPGEDFLAPILHYAHYREIAQAIAEVRDPAESFEHHEMWDAFYWKPDDEKELAWLLRRERLAEINKSLLEKFKANVQSGSGVHSLEHLETAFAQKLKHDLWEGTQYLGFEDFKSKSEAWPHAAREVATLIRDSRRLDANSKLLLVEYCHLRGSLSIEDVYLLYFYISYVNTSQDSGIASEANSAAVKKVVELTLAPVSLSGKVLTAAAGGAVARLFKLFLSDAGEKDQINMEEFQNPESSLERVDDFEVFTDNFLRFISYQREMLGEEAFEKQYPLEGFDDRSRKTGAR